MLKKCFTAMVAAAAFALAVATPAQADGRLVLKSSQAFDFTKSAVTRIGDPAADLSFAVTGPSKTATLTASKIKQFGSSPPAAAAFNDIRSWSGSIASPLPGYYVVQGHDRKTVYLVQVTDIESQGKTASVSAIWEKLW